MKKFSMKDLIRLKKAGDGWCTPKAPEEFHTWHPKKPWRMEDFKKYGAAIVAVRLSASIQPNHERDEWTPKAPLFINNCQFTGAQTISQNISTTLYIRVTSALAVKEHIEAYQASMEFYPKSWTVKELEVYIPNRGNTLQFGVFNPNGLGPSLYMWHLKNDDYSRRFDELTRFDIDNHIGRFFEEYAHCKLIPGLKSECVMKVRKMDIASA
jgi:hypothetical protein